MRSRVSKLFRAYGLYNVNNKQIKRPWITKFQSSFELTGYITQYVMFIMGHVEVSKLFRAYGLYNEIMSDIVSIVKDKFQSSFELTGYITNSKS